MLRPVGIPWTRDLAKVCCGARSERSGRLGHALLIIVYRAVKRQTTYIELGADFLDRLDPDRLTRHLVKRPRKLGR